MAGYVEEKRGQGAAPPPRPPAAAAAKSSAGPASSTQGSRPLSSVLSLSLYRSLSATSHTRPPPSPPPHTPFPKYPGIPRRRAAPARGRGGIQTPLHNITTTARRDWRPRGGEARVSRAPIGHAAALARAQAPPPHRGRGGAQEGGGAPSGRARWRGVWARAPGAVGGAGARGREGRRLGTP